MKVQSNKNPTPAFKPVSMTITFESQKELDAIGALFNFNPVADVVEEYCKCDVGEAIREEAENIGADLHHEAFNFFDSNLKRKP